MFKAIVVDFLNAIPPKPELNNQVPEQDPYSMQKSKMFAIGIECPWKGLSDQSYEVSSRCLRRCLRSTAASVGGTPSAISCRASLRRCCRCCLRTGIAVAIPPARTTCFGSFVIHLPAQQKLVEHLLGTDSSGVLLVLLSLDRDALKACHHVDH